MVDCGLNPEWSHTQNSTQNYRLHLIEGMVVIIW